jgi:uncharacterized protein YecE (DUF72 family)
MSKVVVKVFKAGYNFLKRMVKVGCCGFPVARRVYYQTFTCVEVQQTFYHPPKEETLRSWRKEAPEGFEFTLKAWQLITHDPKSPTYKRLKFEIPPEAKGRYGGFKTTPEVLEAWRITRKAAQALESRIIIFQTPPSFRPEEEAIKNLKTFFSTIERGNFLFGWEPRGWPHELVKSLCEELELIHVVDPFKEEAFGAIVYWRLHGKDGYRYRYCDEELKGLFDKIKPSSIYYVMFNNTNMFEDAQRFLRIMGDG